MICPEHRNTHLLFVVTVLKWRFHRLWISQIIVQSNVTSARKQIKGGWTSSAGWPGLLCVCHWKTKKQKKNEMKCEILAESGTPCLHVEQHATSQLLMLLVCPRHWISQLLSEAAQRAVNITYAWYSILGRLWLNQKQWNNHIDSI